MASRMFARASASVGLSYGAHSNLCVNQINRWGSSAQKQKYLPGIASGDSLIAFGLSEKPSGSDAGSLRTEAIAGEAECPIWRGDSDEPTAACPCTGATEFAADGRIAHAKVVQVIDILRQERITKFAINVRPEEIGR